MAKIVFLGTGGDAYLVGKGIRGAGGIIIRFGPHQFHLDPGSGVVVAAKRNHIHLRETLAVLCTSVHLNHSNDVNALISAMSFSGLDRYGVLIAADSVVKGYKGCLPTLQPFFARCVERVVTVSTSPRIGINDVDIHVCHADHDDPHAVGFQLRWQGERISYTGDTAFSDELVESHKHATVLIACVSASSDEQRERHLGIEDAVALANQVKPKVLILTHFSHELVKQDVLALGREVGSQVSCPVVVAEDDMQLDTSTYR